mgnify:CR=1 FL=1
MANDLTDSPLVLDTASDTVVVIQGDRYIYAIKYTAGTTAGHTAVVQYKASSKVIWQASCSGSGNDVGLELIRFKTAPGTAGDCILKTLGSGKVLVYLGPER